MEGGEYRPKEKSRELLQACEETVEEERKKKFFLLLDNDIRTAGYMEQLKRGVVFVKKEEEN